MHPPESVLIPKKLHFAPPDTPITPLASTFLAGARTRNVQTATGPPPSALKTPASSHSQKSPVIRYGVPLGMWLLNCASAAKIESMPKPWS